MQGSWTGGEKGPSRGEDLGRGPYVQGPEFRTLSLWTGVNKNKKNNKKSTASLTCFPHRSLSGKSENWQNRENGYIAAC